MRIKIKNLIFHMTILIIPIFALTEFFPFSLGNKIVLGISAISYIYLNCLFRKQNKRFLLCLSNFVLAFYALYMIIIGQYGAFTNVYFYSYFLLFTFSLLFLFPNILDDYCLFLGKHKREFISSVVIFFALVLISVLNGIGYRYSPFDNIWTLFGPFQIQHMLGYVLLVIYCGASLYDRENKSILFLMMKSISLVLVVLTGVRSAALAFCILVLCDFFSMKTRSRKTTIFVVGVIVLIIIATQTDILKNNNLITKTISAINHGSMTNGREWYREVQLNAFQSKSNVIQKLFGVSIPGVIEYMYQALGVHIHAHNDYINTLVGYGIVGLALFVINQINLCRVCKTVWNKILFNCFFFVLAYFNGLTIYIMLTASLPIVLAFFKEKQIRNTISTNKKIRL